MDAQVKWGSVRIIRPGNQAKICSLSDLSVFHALEFSQQQAPSNLLPQVQEREPCTSSHLALAICKEFRAWAYSGNGLANLIGWERWISTRLSVFIAASDNLHDC